MSTPHEQDILVLTAGDRLPSLVHTLKDSAGATITLYNSTDTVFLRLVNAVTGKVVLNDVTATISDGTAGEVTYDWTVGDTSAAGYYFTQWKISFASGKVEHIRDPFRIHVRNVDGNIQSDWLMTLDCAKAYLDVRSSEYDHRLRLIVPAVTRFLQDRLGYNLIDQTYTHDGTTLQKLDGNGERTYYLQHRPLTAQPSALALRNESDPVFTNVDEIVWYQDDARLQFTGGRVFTRGFQNLAVTYRAGWTIYDNSIAEFAATLPEPILLVGKDLMQKKLLEWENKGPAVSSFSVGTQSVQFTMDDLTASQKAMLAPYWRPRILGAVR